MLVHNLVAKSKGRKMADVHITCINKSTRNNTHEGITHLGGSGWRWSQAQVITSIDANTNSFYLLTPAGERVDVVVVNGLYGKFVQAKCDGELTDHLLELGLCAT